MSLGHAIETVLGSLPQGVTDSSGSEPLPGVEFASSIPALVIALCCSIIAIGVSSSNIYGHLKHYTRPADQKWIVRILAIVPIYALLSFLCMAFPDLALYFETLRDVYEAFVIYCFLTLMLSYAGGESACISAISVDPGAMNHPWPLCCLPKFALDGRFLRRCKQGTLQFVVQKPFTAGLSLIMLLAGVYSTGWYQGILLTIYNVSYTVALYALLLFYLGTRKLVRRHSPIRKFVAVKLVVFATYYQSVIVAMAPGMTSRQAALWNDLILAVEMVFFGLLQMVAFPYSDFKSEKKPRKSRYERLGISDRDNLDGTDVTELGLLTKIKDLFGIGVYGRASNTASIVTGDDIIPLDYIRPGKVRRSDERKRDRNESLHSVSELKVLVEHETVSDKKNENDENVIEPDEKVKESWNTFQDISNSPRASNVELSFREDTVVTVTKETDKQEQSKSNGDEITTIGPALRKGSKGSGTETKPQDNVNQILPLKAKGSVWKNALDVFTFSDVVEDTRTSFRPGYKDYIVQSNHDELNSSHFSDISSATLGVSEAEAATTPAHVSDSGRSSRVKKLMFGRDSNIVDFTDTPLTAHIDIVDTDKLK